jgi:hypothetical protein
MGELADRLGALRVSASAPGGGIHADLRGYSDVDMYFSSGFYEQTSERELEHRLESLARLLWAAQVRAQSEVRSRLGAHPPDDPATVQDQIFAEERERLVAVGRSDDGRITVSVQGMRQWRIQLADDTVRSLDERSFLAAVRVVASRLVADQARQMIQLKGRVYQ